MKKVPLVLVLFVLLFLIWHSARAGYASLITASPVTPNDLARVTDAVRLSPGDSHAHLLLGALLEANDDRAAAIAHYQKAVMLRPDDYILRLQLARGQELAGDTAGAINSATVAVTLAPSYAQPHWQLGNILVRAGRHEEGFSELRLAAASDPAMYLSIIDLAWQLSGGKVEYVRQALHPRTAAAYKTLAHYFQKHGDERAAAQMLVDGGDATANERRAFVGVLITAKKFSAARSLWTADHGHGPDPDSLLEVINPGFEEETDLDEPGFSWRAPSPEKTITLSLDSAAPKAGRNSLRVDFNGPAGTGGEIISQLLLVSPRAHYRVRFAYRAENLVSGGLPNISIADASDNKVLGQTGPLAQTTNGWQDAQIDFTTGESSAAIRIALIRQPCPAPQCPIFGKLWLDNFQILSSNGYLTQF